MDNNIIAVYGSPGSYKTLLTKAVDDRTYNTTIKSLAELVTKEV